MKFGAKTLVCTAIFFVVSVCAILFAMPNNNQVSNTNVHACEVASNGFVTQCQTYIDTRVCPSADSNDPWSGGSGAGGGTTPDAQGKPQVPTGDQTPTKDLDNGAAKSLGKNLATVLSNYVFPFLGIAGALWACWIGIEFGRAKDAGTRQKAKERLIKALASVVIIFVLWAIMASFK